jgi:hypothetical protein
MTRKIFISLLTSLLLLTSFKTAPPAAPITPKAEYVYICNGPRSVVYHQSPDCRGLSHCSTRIEKVTLAYAIKLGRRPCKIEY